VRVDGGALATRDEHRRGIAHRGGPAGRPDAQLRRSGVSADGERGADVVVDHLHGGVRGRGSWQRQGDEDETEGDPRPEQGRKPTASNLI
jgi:hypothetical protein